MSKPKQRVIVLSKTKKQYQKFLDELPPKGMRSWKHHLIPLSRLIFMKNRAAFALDQEETLSFKKCINQAMAKLDIQYSQYWYGIALKRLKDQRRRIKNATFVEFPMKTEEMSLVTEEEEVTAQVAETPTPPPVTRKDPYQYCLFQSPGYGR